MPLKSDSVEELIGECVEVLGVLETVSMPPSVYREVRCAIDSVAARLEVLYDALTSPLPPR